MTKDGIYMDFSVRKSTGADVSTVAAMAGCIWHSAALEELEADFLETMDTPDAAVFLVLEGDTVCGFAQCGLRRDYVEGTCSSPVGYLEGIYVKPEYRKMGCAKMLVTACEDWARAQGCEEFASDCELCNTQSLHFHLRIGFQEANRIICFTKKL